MQKIKKIKIMSSIIVSALLSGCAGTKTNFDCNHVGGIQGCATLGHVNRMADRGDFDRSSKATLTNNADLNTNQNEHFLKTPDDAPLRYGETMQNIWIAPYVTKDGSYMWASMASIIITAGHWIGEPVSAITQGGDV